MDVLWPLRRKVERGAHGDCVDARRFDGGVGVGSSNSHSAASGLALRPTPRSSVRVHPKNIVKLPVVTRTPSQRPNHKMAYDSDSSDGGEEYTETNVLLGYASNEATGDTISHLGGTPVRRQCTLSEESMEFRC